MAPFVPPIVDEINTCVASIKESAELHSDREYSYCCLLYGSDPSDELVANALVLGESMQNCTYPLVLMHTPDVPVHVIEVLKQSHLFTKLVSVEYIRAHESLFKKDWFRDVFTKLHLFNLIEYRKVIFLDLDTMCVHPTKLDELFEIPNAFFGAMENSKTGRELPHGHLMAPMGTCKLINAGLILATPNSNLFKALYTDVTSASSYHVAGMTPEQFYLARVMGHHFVHIAQKYNFEVQYHTGVPADSFWRTCAFSDVVLFHFSGGHPLIRFEHSSTLQKSMEGCQTEKYFARKNWFESFTQGDRDNANHRATMAFDYWGNHFLAVCGKLFEAKNLSNTEILIRFKQLLVLPKPLPGPPKRAAPTL